MPLNISPIKDGEKIEFKNPTKFYEAIGGQEGMKRLMYDFYDRIYESDIAHFFPQDEDEFEKVKEKNTRFFIQLCGGPKIYEEAGDMDLNKYMIHFHNEFSINEKARIEWLGTMREALDAIKDLDEDAKEEFWDYLDKFSKLTVNSFSDNKDIYY